jgi:hypothetical protein
VRGVLRSAAGPEEPISWICILAVALPARMGIEEANERNRDKKPLTAPCHLPALHFALVSSVGDAEKNSPGICNHAIL